MRDITGNVFGGDQMTAWTLMSGPSRTTFVNPQAGLYDRIASVKAIATDTPIEGRIVFTKRAKFPKGLPRFTVMLESVAAEFPKLGAAELEIAVAKYRPGWARLKEAAKPSPHFRNNPIACGLRPRFENQVHRRVHRAAEALEARARHHRSQARLASLRTQTHAAFLRQRAGRAQQRGCRVVRAPDRIEILLDAIARVRLDDHPGAIGRQRLQHVTRSGNRVAHVVQRIEHRDELVRVATIVVGLADLEGHVGEAGFARMPDRGGNRLVVDSRIR